MNDALKSLDRRHLDQRLEELEIEVGSNSEGKFIVCTFSEPFFCLERDSEEEAKAAIVETLQSYIRTFYKGLDGVKITLRKDSPTIPQQYVKPISRLRPTFAGHDDQRQFAMA